MPVAGARRRSYRAGLHYTVDEFPCDTEVELSVHADRTRALPAVRTPAIAPPIVHEVLGSAGGPLPERVRDDMQARLGHDFSDIRIHTDERAAASARAVAAEAYTVGRQVVFNEGRYDPASASGRRLLSHELAHAMAHPRGAPPPIGRLPISSPGDAEERRAGAVAGGALPSQAPSAAAPRLFRAPSAIVQLSDLTVNEPRVTVPPIANLSLTATKSPSNAPGVTFSLVADTGALDPGTVVDPNTGKITVAASQNGGAVHVEAVQNWTAPDGTSIASTTPFTAAIAFAAIPSGIASTSAVAANASGQYGGQFTHTFSSPAGGPSALNRAHVNERFAAAKGTSLVLSGKLGTVTVAVNDPNRASAGWDLDGSGAMLAPDDIDWGNTIDARPFVANASNPSPSDTLPQALTADQEFRNLSFPDKTYGASAVARVTHRRAIEERGGALKAITSANGQEIVDDYTGPSIFRRCRASQNAISVAAPAPAKGTPAPAAPTTTVSVDVEGRQAVPKFEVRAPDLGCTITQQGVLTAGPTPGNVTVRAGDGKNFDETTITLKPLPTPNPTPPPKGTGTASPTATSDGSDAADTPDAP
jgi:Domain of unknown function (DUF4157)